MFDATAEAILAAGLDTVALLGTGSTMREAFYREHMATHGITTLAPEEPDAENVHRLIFDHLASGVIPEGARELLSGIVDKLVSQGAQGMISGCTEIPMALKAEDIEVHYFDSMALHVAAALKFALHD